MTSLDISRLKSRQIFLGINAKISETLVHAHCVAIEGSLTSPGGGRPRLDVQHAELEEFTAVWLTDTVILEDGLSWICTKLRELEVFFVISTPSAQFEIISRLSELNRLERLDMGDVHYLEAVPGQELRLTLKHGLDMLKSLRALVSLIGPKCRAKMAKWGKAEVDWVLQNWPRIETITHYVVNGQPRDPSE